MTAPANSPWNDKTIARLKELWGMGFSCSQIARQLGGGLSRGAVIGKLHRLGISKLSKGEKAAQNLKREKSGWQKIAIGRSAANKRPIPKISKSPIQPDLDLALRRDPDAPLHQRKTILVKQDGKVFANDKLTQSCCRWGIGDPAEKDFHFCGAQTIPGLAYCEQHARRAYQANPITVAERLRPSRVPTFRDYLEEELL